MDIQPAGPPAIGPQEHAPLQPIQQPKPKNGFFQGIKDLFGSLKPNSSKEASFIASAVDLYKQFGPSLEGIQPIEVGPEIERANADEGIFATTIGQQGPRNSNNAALYNEKEGTVHFSPERHQILYAKYGDKPFPMSIGGRIVDVRLGKPVESFMILQFTRAYLIQQLVNERLRALKQDGEKLHTHGERQPLYPNATKEEAEDALRVQQIKYSKLQERLEEGIRKEKQIKEDVTKQIIKEESNREKDHKKRLREEIGE